MIYKSKIDVLNIVIRLVGLLASLVAVYICFLFYLKGFSNGNLVSGMIWIIAMFVSALFGWKCIGILFRCRYVFEDYKLIVIIGKKETYIQFNKVLSVEKVNNIFRQNTLAINKLRIEYIGDEVRKTIFISPKDLDEVIKELKIHCKSMKIIK